MPIDRGAIDAQLRDIGEGERWWEHREFRDLPHILHTDERIQGIVRGKLLGRRRPRVRPTGRWIIVATDQRVICLKQERFARKQVEIAAGEIVAVHHRSGLRAYQITIQTPQRRYRIRIPKVDAFRFAGAISPLVPQSGAGRVHPELEPWAWIPGMSAAASLPGISGLLSKVAMLSPPDYATRDHLDRLETAVDRLQQDVERLQQQVGFLESLLEKRAKDALLLQRQHAPGHSGASGLAE